MIIDNSIKMLEEPKKIMIDDKNYIKISKYQKRDTIFYDVIFINLDKEKFIGRYKDFNNMNVSYKDSKILVFSQDVDNFIIKVHTLYDILDDINYSLSEIEALKVFDSSIDSSKLINKEKSIVRCDVEKRHRLVK